MKRVLLHVMLPLVVLALGAAGVRSFMGSAGSAESEDRPEVAPLVAIEVARAYEGRAYVEGSGIVEPEREASLSPEVTGRVVQVSDALAEGSRVKQGHVLLRIDDSRYRLALRQQRAQVKRAELEVEVERSAGEAARREWAVSGQEPPADARRIALRVPQLELAASEDEAYIDARLRDSHDLWHVVTGYGGDLLGEASLLAFTYAQTWSRGIGLIASVGLLRADDPDDRRLIVDAFVRGLRAAWMPAVAWEDWLAAPLVDVRTQLRVGPPPAYEPFFASDLPPGGLLARHASLTRARVTVPAPLLA